MTTAHDELVDVIAEAIADDFYRMSGGDPAWPEAPDPNEGDYSLAHAVLDALVERYGEPEIEGRKWYQFGALSEAEHQHRLVFPWQAVKEGDQG